MIAKCDTPACEKKGILGNVIRTYEVTSPLTVFSTQLCFKCFQYQDNRNKNRPRRHISIRDKVHV